MKIKCVASAYLTVVTCLNPQFGELCVADFLVVPRTWNFHKHNSSRRPLIAVYGCYLASQIQLGTGGGIYSVS